MIEKKLLVYLFLIVCILCFVPFTHGFRYQTVVNRRLEEFEVGQKTGFYAPKGIAMCTAKRALKDARSMIYQVRSIFNSSLPIAISHCNELPDWQIVQFQDEKDIIFVNVCQNNETVIRLDQWSLQRRLRSWYCKAATLVFVPFREVIVMDLDTIWFKNPDTLFSYKDYQESGALFFRDRFYHTQPAPPRQTFHNKTLSLIQSHLFPQLSVNETSNKVLFTPEYAQKQVAQNGVVYFWRHLANSSVDPELDSYQDSSVLVLNRAKHPIFLQVLAKLIPKFNIGWGDKEMYWMAAIISKEMFTMEPFLTGNYGPCGFILHFDPNDKEKLMKNPNAATDITPLYANAEWFIEQFSAVGAGNDRFEITFLFFHFLF
jgi:hypothetical protein